MTVAATENTTQGESTTSCETAVNAGLPRTAKLQMTVLVAGLVTTGLSLFGVYLLNFGASVNIMGWYANYVLPVGALLVGLAASSGYGLTSWLSGVKIRKRLLLTLIALQTIAYVLAQYIEFSSLGALYDINTGQQVGFTEYFHEITLSFAFKGRGGQPGTPLGYWGYGLRALEVIGFVGGSLIVPGLLMRVPYCETCRLYMRTRELALFAASVPVRKVGKKDLEAQAAYAAEQQQAHAKGLEGAQTLTGCGANNDTRTFREIVAAAAPEKKTIAKLPVRIAVSLVSCKHCAGGYLKTEQVAGKGDKVEKTELAKTTVTPDFVRTIKDL
jgi:hypothetical protein